MGKYYDRLKGIYESCQDGKMFLTNYEKALAEDDGESKKDRLINAFKKDVEEYGDLDEISISRFCDWLLELPSEKKEEEKEEPVEESLDGEDGKISVSTDDLTDQQKKDILINDKEIDKKVVQDMSPEEMDGALKADAGKDDDAKPVSEEVEEVPEQDFDGYCRVRVDDDDLDLHGYIESPFADSEDALKLAEFSEEAYVFQNRLDAYATIDKVCDKFFYDDSTFKIEPVEDGSDDEEENSNWVTIDPIENPVTVTDANGTI